MSGINEMWRRTESREKSDGEDFVKDKHIQ